MKESEDKIHLPNGLAYKIIEGKKVFILVKEPDPAEFYKKADFKEDKFSDRKLLN